MIELKSYLEGKWVSGEGEGSTLVNPATAEPIATTSTQGLNLAAAVTYARDVGGPNLRKMTFVERAAALKTLAKAIHEHREELIDASMINNGATRGDAKFDVDGASGTIAAYASIGKHLGERTFLVEGDEGEPLLRAPRFSGYHVKMPRPGVAVHINAFNFPAWGLGEKLAVSLLAGVPAIAKPATSTALTAFKLVEVLIGSGALPDGALQLLCGSVGDLLSHLGPHDHVAFTGGASTAAKIRGHETLIKHNVRVNLEADSLNAAVVAPDVDTSSDAYGVFLRHVEKELTQKAGQKCTATRRILIHRDMIDDVQAELIEILKDKKVGDPRTEGVTVGPVATKSQHDDAIAGIAALVEAGAEVVMGGPDAAMPHGDNAANGYFVAPTLLRVNDPNGAPAVHEREVFAPVTTLIAYDDIDQAIEIVGKGGGSLVSSIYSDDKANIAKLSLGIAPFNGRVVVGSSKVAEQMIHPGMVLPTCIHGGPGRAGGGEELGGLRGLDFYMQRTVIQGDRGVLDRAFGLK
jgi:oxepin-CoA hydrolase/3-oxo-5,6-dehydrosuberyl-CoA semialdehyde dehydrogenase